VAYYNLRIKVAAGKNQVELFHQPFCKWYLKIREVDAQAVIYPWMEKVWDVTTFEELLMTMMATQNINKSGWMDPSDDWG